MSFVSSCSVVLGGRWASEVAATGGYSDTLNLMQTSCAGSIVPPVSVVSLPVQFGNDTYLKRFISIKQDAIKRYADDIISKFS